MYCRKCNMEGEFGAKICRACGSILDEGPEAVATGDDGFQMSWLEPSSEPIEAVAVESVENFAPLVTDEPPLRPDWQCVQCGSIVPGDVDVCFRCVTAQGGIAHEQQTNLQEFLDQVEAEQGPAEPVPEYVNEAPIEAVEVTGQLACSRCGSYRMMTGVSIEDKGQFDSTLRVRVGNDPLVTFFGGAFRSPIAADICGECGHIELRVTNPRELYRRWKSEPWSR